jgi:hypothetical protein
MTRPSSVHPSSASRVFACLSTKLGDLVNIDMHSVRQGDLVVIFLPSRPVDSICLSISG